MENEIENFCYVLEKQREYYFHRPAIGYKDYSIDIDKYIKEMKEKIYLFIEYMSVKQNQEKNKSLYNRFLFITDFFGINLSFLQSE